MPNLQLVQEPAADALLNANPFALLVGMLLDQQVPMETAFAGPKKIADRMGSFDAGDIADYDPDKFVALCSERPAIHRFPGSMAKRIQALAQIIVDRYDGDAAALWTAGEPDGNELLRRLKGLPGFGEQKARIFLALLGKQYGVTPKGWQVAAGEFGQPGTYLSVADIVDAGSLGQVRSHKRQGKRRPRQRERRQREDTPDVSVRRSHHRQGRGRAGRADSGPPCQRSSRPGVRPRRHIVHGVLMDHSRWC